jgi:gluconokinase
MTEHVVMMGVSGCGKSVVGAALARIELLPFVEGDSFHPPANIAKMSAGIPLVDADRVGWLDALGREMMRHPDGAIVSCSALKRIYRDRLRAAVPGLRFVFLELTPEESIRRVSHREHFFPATLVENQFATLESPVGEPGVLRLDATGPVADLAEAASRWLAG